MPIEPVTVAEVYRKMARKFAESNGHTPGEWQYWSDSDIIQATCTGCGLAVMINTVPIPGEFRLDGSALLQECQASPEPEVVNALLADEEARLIYEVKVAYDSSFGQMVLVEAESEKAAKQKILYIEDLQEDEPEPTLTIRVIDLSRPYYVGDIW